MTAAGELDRRLQFRRAGAVDDGFATTDAWADLGAPVWGKRVDVSDGERWRAAAVEAVISARFTVRHSAFTAAITPADRLVEGGQEFEITGIRQAAAGRRRFLEISAAARVA